MIPEHILDQLTALFLDDTIPETEFDDRFTKMYEMYDLSEEQVLEFTKYLEGKEKELEVSIAKLETEMDIGMADLAIIESDLQYLKENPRK